MVTYSESEVSLSDSLQEASSGAESVSDDSAAARWRLPPDLEARDFDERPLEDLAADDVS